MKHLRADNYVQDIIKIQRDCEGIPVNALLKNGVTVTLFIDHSVSFGKSFRHEGMAKKADHDESFRFALIVYNQRKNGAVGEFRPI